MRRLKAFFHWVCGYLWFFFFFNDTATTEIYTLSLHDALPILHLLSLPARSRQWLAANPHAVAYAFARRINWRGQSRLRLSPTRLLTLTTIAGLDNSCLLPPTARSHRSEDLLLGAVAQWMHRTAWQVDLPFGLLHRREPAKHWLRAVDSVAPEPL